MKLTVDIVLDILQYMNPHKIDELVESSPLWGLIINMMDRAKYIRRWLRLYDTTYQYIPRIYEICGKIHNKWYFKLCFEENTYKVFLWVAKGIKNKTICIKLSYTSIVDVSALKDIYHVEFKQCNGIECVDSLCNATVLLLDIWYIKDVSSLGNVENLYLWGCEQISDVSNLWGIQGLELWECDNIDDISMLDGLYSVAINDCDKITDISCMSGVYNIYITRLSISDVSRLGGVHTVRLSICDEISDIGCLGGIDDLDVWECKNVDNVDNLGGVARVKLQGCNRLTNIGNLGGITKLELVMCPMINDVSICDGITDKNIDLDYNDLW